MSFRNFLAGLLCSLVGHDYADGWETGQPWWRTTCRTCGRKKDRRTNP